MTENAQTSDVQNVVFRAATNGDGARIRELIFDVLREYGLEPDPEGADADLRDIEAQYLAPGGSFECIEDAHGTLLGTVGLFRLDTIHCELRKMYFIPEARGKGLGKRTLARTLHHAKRLGFRKVNLETAGALKEAIGLYQRFGFRRIDAAPCVARCDQAYELDLDQWIPPGFCEESGVPHKIL
jgi:putative acetyltransferase